MNWQRQQLLYRGIRDFKGNILPFLIQDAPLLCCVELQHETAHFQAHPLHTINEGRDSPVFVTLGTEDLLVHLYTIYCLGLGVGLQDHFFFELAINNHVECVPDAAELVRLACWDITLPAMELHVIWDKLGLLCSKESLFEISILVCFSLKVQDLKMKNVQ